MELTLSGRSALIFGSTQGIGHAIATLFAHEGATVTLVGRNPSSLQDLIATLDGEGHNHLVVDQEDPESILAGAKQVSDKVYDIIVNNTGGPDPGLVSDESWGNFEKALTKQLRCSQEFTRAILPGMRQRKFGRVINIISTSVKVPIYGLGVSNTVRGAVASWAKTLSMEVGVDGITVNNLLPVFINTGRLKQIIDNQAVKSGKSPELVGQEMAKAVPVGRFGEPQEMAATALFLCSEHASYITGTSIRVDGGRTGSI